MKTLGVIANSRKPRAAEVLWRITRRASELGMVLRADEQTSGLVETLQCVPAEELHAGVDAIMALGGDGTLLRVVRELGDVEKPVIGVNIGGLGFLTSVAEDDLDTALECLASDDFSVTSTAILEGAIHRGGERIATYRALNEILITRGASRRVVSLNVSIDGHDVTSYVCDGLMVATPSGSTGHSLSAGGPILAPETSAFVISLICPHTLGSRPLVVPDRCEVLISGGEH
jgi:NAD+ kinase